MEVPRKEFHKALLKHFGDFLTVSSMPDTTALEYIVKGLTRLVEIDDDPGYYRSRQTVSVSNLLKFKVE